MLEVIEDMLDIAWSDFVAVLFAFVMHVFVSFRLHACCICMYAFTMVHLMIVHVDPKLCNDLDRPEAHLCKTLLPACDVSPCALRASCRLVSI